MSNQSNTPSNSELLIVVALVSAILFFSLAFQTVQIKRDRDALQVFKTQQDKPLEDSRKVQAQVTALALGTKKLADGGDKNAVTIIDRLKQLGISVGDQPPAAAAAPAPAP